MTEKLFYENVYLREFTARVVGCEQKGNGFIIELDRTAFYPEGGGQPADQGFMRLENAGDIEEDAASAVVSDVHERDGNIIHTCNKPFEVGTKVECQIDWERRFDHMQQHSGEHIVSGMLCSAFDCDNIGFHMGREIVQIDYNADISWKEVQEIEKKANQYIWENHEFVQIWPTRDELKTINYRSKKELTGMVRITSFPGADICACCGTHVSRSGEVGLVKMLSVQKIKEGVRIELLCGKRALDYLSGTWQQNLLISQELSSKPGETYEAVRKLKNDGFEMKGRLAAAQDGYFGLLAESYKNADSPLVITGPADSDGVRRLCDMIAENATGCCKVFAGNDGDWKYAVIEKGADIREFIKNMNSALGGRGGGRDGFAQGSASCTIGEIRDFFKNL